MINSRNVYFYIYFACLLILAPINLLSFDTYYYWDWSRHLDLSYYDGSPMIAYFIKLSTLIFGDTLFSLTLVGILVTALTGWIIYKTARQFLPSTASYVATSLWLFSPLVTLDQLQQTTYDTPLSLFWALTLYYVIRYIKHQTTSDLYKIGISIGLMLLSKYSGIVLVFSLIIFLITSQYRSLFKSFHFYVALVLSIICFSPVILWNYQHQWQSFAYQLTIHQLGQGINPIKQMLHSYFYIFLPALNFMLIPPIICWIKKDTDQCHSIKIEISSNILMLCRVVCASFICFYLFTACKAGVRGSWLTPYLITSALLGGYCYQKYKYYKSTIALIIGYALVSVLIILNNNYLYNFVPSKKLFYYQLMKQFNKIYPTIPDVVFSSGWFEARMLFFIKNKPIIYTVDCDSLQNQYALWSMNIQQKISTKSVQEALFIDLKDRSICLKKYFDHCVQLPTLTTTTSYDVYSIYAYKCTNYINKKNIFNNAIVL